MMQRGSSRGGPQPRISQYEGEEEGVYRRRQPGGGDYGAGDRGPRQQYGGHGREGDEQRGYRRGAEPPDYGPPGGEYRGGRGHREYEGEQQEGYRGGGGTRQDPGERRDYLGRSGEGGFQPREEGGRGDQGRGPERREFRQEPPRRGMPHSRDYSREETPSRGMSHSRDYPREEFPGRGEISHSREYQRQEFPSRGGMSHPRDYPREEISGRGMTHMREDFPSRGGMSHPRDCPREEITGRGMTHMREDFPSRGGMSHPRDYPREEISGRGMTHTREDFPSRGGMSHPHDYPREEIPGRGMTHMREDFPSRGGTSHPRDYPREEIPGRGMALREDLPGLRGMTRSPEGFPSRGGMSQRDDTRRLEYPTYSARPEPTSELSIGRREERQDRPRGRSAIFAEMRKAVSSAHALPQPAVEPSRMLPPDSSSSTSPPKTVGGRGRMLRSDTDDISPRAPLGDTRELSRRLSEVHLQESDEEKAPLVMKGSHGRPVSVACNYVRLNVEVGKGFFQYDVQFEPEVDSRGARFALLNSVKHIIGETKLFDGAVLYLPVQLQDKVTIAHGLLLDNTAITIRITLVKQRRFGDSQVIHLYNVLFRKIMSILGLALHGKNFYDPKSAMPIPLHKLEVWPGYITAIDEYEGGVMLCCDASHRVLRNQTVLELLNDMRNSNRSSWKDEFCNLILGQSVLTRYNNKVYRIDDISFDETPRDSFEKRDGRSMTYIEYYNHQYNIRLTEMDQPLLKSKVKSKIRGQDERQLVSLVPELCFLTGITDVMRQDLRVMKDITQCINIQPSQRMYAINQFVKNITASPNASKVISDWGLSIDTAYIHMQGRILPPLEIYFGNEERVGGTMEASWNSACSRNRVLQAVEMLNWIVVCTRKDDKMVSSFLEQIRKCGPQVGMQIVNPRVNYLQDDRTESYIRTLRSTLNNNTQLAMVIFPVARTDKYSAVKKLCCIDSPIPSQVILTRTIKNVNKLRAIALKVALQMNCKLGGTLWTVHIPLQSSMVCGMDTFHDPRRQSKSIGALVSSLNQPLTRWYSKVYSQAPGLELVDGLEVAMISCLQKYRDINGTFPQQLLLFRDGVSDGQLSTVAKYELPQILKACRRISPDYEPKVLLVVVQKRINTRIFGNEKKGDYTNPLPGTLVDNTITRRFLFDFFLVSQNVRQGTVSPTHYIVVQNSTNMGPDQVQRLSYALTHLYYNWPGTIRVPAPCQYAHKLAYLVGENIHKEADEILADKLFYL